MTEQELKAIEEWADAWELEGGDIGFNYVRTLITAAREREAKVLALQSELAELHNAYHAQSVEMTALEAQAGMKAEDETL